MTTTTNPHRRHCDEAVELKIWGTSDGDLYRRCGLPVITALARRMAAGTFDEALAPKAFATWADLAAKGYAADAGGGAIWNQMFSTTARREAAELALAYYRDHITDAAADMTQERTNRKRWTLAAIRAANEEAGHFFFSRDTMKFFGDTMKSWAVSCEGSGVYVVRVKPMRDRDGRDMGGVGTRRAFDPETGHIASASAG